MSVYTKNIQEYVLHLSNGDNITVEDDTYGANRYYLPESIAKAKDQDSLWFGDAEKGFTIVPKRSIVYITMGDSRTVPVNSVQDFPVPEFRQEAVRANA